MRLAFVTDAEHPKLYQDDLPLKDYLEAQGILISVVVWNNPMTTWTEYDYIIIRSVWDYFQKENEFSQWLGRLESENIRVFNPVSVLNWNKHKSYLLEFAKADIRIPETEYVFQNQSISLSKILSKRHWTKAVIKPTVSAGAYKTWIVTHENVKQIQSFFDALITEQDVLIQKFAEEIISQGEISLIFFNKKFSHAVLKTAKQGDFRVQHQYGGKYIPYSPTDNILAQVANIISKIEDPLLYARIDGFYNINNQFSLMELELIEPVLFFESDASAAENFYSGFLEIISSLGKSLK
ncbi:MAG: hypothetical protein ABI844_02900 [Saprospiraceae bacterium]